MDQVAVDGVDRRRRGPRSGPLTCSQTALNEEEAVARPGARRFGSQGPNGEWSSPSGRVLFRHAPAAGSTYQGVLHRRLVEHLGVRFGPVTNGYAEVVGIDRDARRAFGRRRVAIERAMAEHGVRSNGAPRSPP